MNAITFEPKSIRALFRLLKLHAVWMYAHEEDRTPNLISSYSSACWADTPSSITHATTMLGSVWKVCMQHTVYWNYHMTHMHDVHTHVHVMYTHYTSYAPTLTYVCNVMHIHIQVMNMHMHICAQITHCAWGKDTTQYLPKEKLYLFESNYTLTHEWEGKVVVAKKKPQTCTCTCTCTGLVISHTVRVELSSPNILGHRINVHTCNLQHAPGTYCWVLIGANKIQTWSLHKLWVGIVW